MTILKCFAIDLLFWRGCGYKEKKVLVGSEDCQIKQERASQDAPVGKTETGLYLDKSTVTGVALWQRIRR